MPLESEAPPWFAVLSMLSYQFETSLDSFQQDIHFRGMQKLDIVLVKIDIHYGSDASIFIFRDFERKFMLQELGSLKICIDFI